MARTGSILGELDIAEPAPRASGLPVIQRALSAHVRSRVNGSAGTIAAFASGDRGAITQVGDDVMRAAGLPIRVKTRSNWRA